VTSVVTDFGIHNILLKIARAYQNGRELYSHTVDTCYYSPSILQQKISILVATWYHVLNFPKNI